MHRKAFLGTGLLGSNFVKAMAARGESVNVWNRTSSKAMALEPFGARAFENPGEAVKGAGLIHLALKDDDSVDEVLKAAAPYFEQGAIIIDHTTTSREGAIRRTEAWRASGFFYQHAPVFMGPANALEATGFMLVSGDEALIQVLQPELSKMTGKLMNLGSETGKAAAIKLVGNAFLVCFTFSLRETMGLAKSLGISLEEMNGLFEQWNPGAQLLGRLNRMATADHSQPSWELAMARKDTELFLEAARKQNIHMDLLPSIAGIMDEWINKGFGSQDWTVVAKEFR